jgi:hypothetical protein
MRRFLPRRSLRREKYRSLGALLPRGLFVVGIVALGGAWAYVLSGSRMLGDGGRILPALLTASIAAASIIYSLGRGQAAAKDQYTLSLIARRFDESDYAQRIHIIGDLRREGRLTPDTTLVQLAAMVWSDPLNDGADKVRAGHAVFPVLNYWEHCCTAYVDDRINRRIFEDLAQDLVRELVNRHARIIGDMRVEEDDNMEHLCAVWFILASDAEREAAVRVLGPVPHRLCPDDKWRWRTCAAKPRASAG